MININNSIPNIIVDITHIMLFTIPSDEHKLNLTLKFNGYNIFTLLWLNKSNIMCDDIPIKNGNAAILRIELIISVNISRHVMECINVLCGLCIP